MAGISDDGRRRIRMGWLEVDFHYGVDWKSVLAVIAVAALLLGSFAFAYFRVRREITRREQIDALLRELTRNLPGAVLKIAVAPDGTMTAPFVAGNTMELFGIAPSASMQDPVALLNRFRPYDRAHCLPVDQFRARSNRVGRGHRPDLDSHERCPSPPSTRWCELERILRGCHARECAARCFGGIQDVGRNRRECPCRVFGDHELRDPHPHERLGRTA